jgi:hypothetical protein
MRSSDQPEEARNNRIKDLTPFNPRVTEEN